MFICIKKDRNIKLREINLNTIFALKQLNNLNNSQHLFIIYISIQFNIGIKKIFFS